MLPLLSPVFRSVNFYFQWDDDGQDDLDQTIPTDDIWD